MKKRVSILMPTRSRSEAAIKSIRSLVENCEDIDNFEVLLAVDNDDFESTKRIVDSFDNKVNMRIYSFDRLGYKGLHKYYNALALAASGSSLLLWNDDTIMVSQNWDKEIISNHNTFCVLSPKVQNMEGYWLHQGVLFPIIPKRWIEITGEWSQIPCCDSVMDVLSKYFNIQIRIDSVVILHDRYELTGNNKDTTYVEGREELLVCPECPVNVNPDNPNPTFLDTYCKKIKEYLDKNGYDL